MARLEETELARIHDTAKDWRKKVMRDGGSPRTGKTHEAKALAAALVRQGILLSWKPKTHFSEQTAVDKIVARRVFASSLRRIRT